MKRLYLFMLLAVAGISQAFAKWNTNATPICVYDASNRGDYYACNPLAVRTPDKKTWITWRTMGKKTINGIDRTAVRTFLQLLDRNGVPQFDEPITVNDHISPSWWSKYALAVAADGSAIVTVADSRTSEEGITDEEINPGSFTPAIYKIDQEGNFLWGLDGIEFSQFRDAPYTYCYVVGEDTYFVFFNTGNEYTSVIEGDEQKTIGEFIQRINDDGTVAWDQPRKWADDFIPIQMVPTTDNELLLFDHCPDGARVHRLNSNFEEVWGEPVIYDDHKYDGYVMNPYEIVPDGEGGAAVAFVRTQGLFSHNIRVQHINADGSLGFGLTGLDAANTEDNDYDYCGIAVNPKTQEILVDFESQLESSYDVMLQKFSYEGDYLFNELGLSIASKDLLANVYAFGRVGIGAVDNGDWIVAYRDVSSYANMSFVIRRYNEDGKRLWTRTIGRDLDPSDITFLVEDNATYMFYREKKSTKEPGIKIFRIAHDGSYNVEDDGTTGIDEVKPAATTRQYFSPDGKQFSQPQRGLNIVRTADGNVRKQYHF